MGGHKDDKRRSHNDDRRKRDRDDRKRRDDEDDRLRERRCKDNGRDDKRREERRGRDERDRKRRSRSRSKEPERKKIDTRKDSKKSPSDDHSPSEEDNGGLKEKLSMSVDETNKLRIKLGLAPLTTGDDDDDKSSASTERREVHAPAINIGHVRKQEKLRKDLEILMETQRLKKSLFKVPLLFNEEEDDEEDDVGSTENWIEQNRKKTIQREEEEKLKELQKAKISFSQGSTNGLYSSINLTGTKVEHSFDSFEEGKEVILTLKSKNFLDDSEDVLENTLMVENEKIAQNLNNMKNKFNESYFDDFDEDGQFVKRGVLAKYDEEIYGAKKKFYFIGDQSCKKEDPEIYEDKIKTSLTLPELVPAKDFYSTEELINFKKPKIVKSRNLRKKTKVTADDLLATISSEEVTEELKTSEGHGKVTLPSLDDIASRKRKHDDDEEENQFLGEDDNNDDLNSFESCLKMNTKKKVKVEALSSDDFYEQIKSTPAIKEETSSQCVYRIGQFYGSIGSSDTQSQPIKEEPKWSVDMENSEIVPKEEIDDNDEEEEEEVNESGEKEERLDFLYEEPLVGRGLAGALKVSQNKGFLDTQPVKITSVRISNMTAIVDREYTIEDKKIKEQESKGRNVPQSNDPFMDLVDYKPDVNITYTDDKNNELGPKEAFRHMSHSFHGKCPGKKKKEQRMRRDYEKAQAKMYQDADLGTAKILKAAQMTKHEPYVILKTK